MKSMQAVQIHTYGNTDVLTYAEVPRPTPSEDEVLIRVQATTVNPFDCAARAGYLSAWYNYAFPFTLGLDVAGVVEEVGAGVTNIAPGDLVYTRTDPSRNGAYAEFVVVPASQVVAKPQSLDATEAAALPHVGLTAWAALIKAAKLSAGQTVLIHGAAGGVGHIAIQLAKWRGAKVIGTASGYNLDYLRSLGVDEAIDYTSTPFETVVRDVDVVFDTVGGDTQERSWSVLKPGGMLVSFVQPPSAETATAYGVRQQFVTADQTDSEVLTQLAELVDRGQLKPTVSLTLPLQEIKQAHELSQGRHIRGKIVLKVTES